MHESDLKEHSIITEAHNRRVTSRDRSLEIEQKKSCEETGEALKSNHANTRIISLV